MKFILSLILIFISIPAWGATTWYVRNDGGTATQCTGTTNAAYPGSGTGVACAFNHPSWALGASGNSSATMVGGDTLIIDDVDELVGHGQAQYPAGVGMPNDSGSGCNVSAFPYGCGLNSIPPGTDSSHTTKIYGSKYANGCSAKPQLYGTQSVTSVLSAGGDYIDVECLELTQHSACSFRGPIDSNVDGDPMPCPESYPTTVNYARAGFTTPTNIHHLTLTNMYIHNVESGLLLGNGSTGTVGDINLTNVYLIGNSEVGMQTGTATQGDGTITWINSKVEFSGCSEHYPLPDPNNIEDKVNFHHCWEQNQGGYGDGAAFGNTGSGNPGNWIFKGGSYSWNTQDGIDTLHGNGTGSVLISRILAEGNAGQQIKPVGTTINVENSIINGNCSFFEGQTLSSPTASVGTSGGCTSIGGTWDSSDIPNKCVLAFNGSCRANGTVIIVSLNANVTANFYNNIINSGGANIVYELNGTGNTCNGSTKVSTENNIYIGGYSWLDDTYHNGAGGNSITTLYNDAGSTGGTCDSIVLTGDYESSDGNFKSSDSGCVGAHSKCRQDPKIIGPISNGHGSRASYYSGTSYYLSDYLQSTSSLRNAGDSTITYQNGSSDYNSVTRPPWDIGAVNYNSCIVQGNSCSFNSSCCSGICSNGVCAATGYDLQIQNLQLNHVKLN